MAMRGGWSVGAVCVLQVLLTTLLTGCQRVYEATAEGAGPSRTAAAAQPSGYGAVFLGSGECSSFGPTRFVEVPCSSERAAARVTARHDGSPDDGPPCPPTTDFVLRIAAQRKAPGGDGGDGGARGGASPQGYACLRDLEPPHPGDPGGGGGPLTIVGDCVYGSGRDEVRETACDGSGKRKPEYEVTRAVRSHAQCPPSTALYVQLGGAQPVGCARKL
jgi:hypothetical protein